MSDLRAPRAPLSYSIAGAAEATGYSERTIHLAIAAGDIQRRYATSKPVILASDLRDWLESLPTEKPGAGS